jgi:hypothetical protein
MAGRGERGGRLSLRIRAEQLHRDPVSGAIRMPDVYGGAPHEVDARRATACSGSSARRSCPEPGIGERPSRALLNGAGQHLLSRPSQPTSTAPVSTAPSSSVTDVSVRHAAGRPRRDGIDHDLILRRSWRDGGSGRSPLQPSADALRGRSVLEYRRTRLRQAPRFA